MPTSARASLYAPAGQNFCFPDLMLLHDQTGRSFNGFYCGDGGRIMFPRVCATIPLAMVKLMVASILLSLAVPASADVSLSSRGRR